MTEFILLPDPSPEARYLAIALITFYGGLIILIPCFLLSLARRTLGWFHYGERISGEAKLSVNSRKEVVAEIPDQPFRGRVHLVPSDQTLNTDFHLVLLPADREQIVVEEQHEKHGKGTKRRVLRVDYLLKTVGNKKEKFDKEDHKYFVPKKGLKTGEFPLSVSKIVTKKRKQRRTRLDLIVNFVPSKPRRLLVDLLGPYWMRNFLSRALNYRRSSLSFVECTAVVGVCAILTATLLRWACVLRFGDESIIYSPGAESWLLVQSALWVFLLFRLFWRDQETPSERVDQIFRHIRITVLWIKGVFTH